MSALALDARTPATLLLILAVLVVAAADYLDGREAVMMLRALGVALLAAQLLGIRDWLQYRNGRWALALAGATGAAAVACNVSPWTILDGAVAMIPAAVLLVTTSIVRPAFEACGLDRYLAAVVTRAPARLRSFGLDLLSMITGLGAGFGSVAMLGAALGGRAEPREVAGNAAMRGLAVAMLLGPSIASVAVIRANLPPSPWLPTLLTALPLVAASLAINAMLSPALRLQVDAGGRSPLHHALAVPMLASVPLIALAATGFAELEATSAITIGCLVTGLALAYRHHPVGTTAMLDGQIRAGWRRSQSEIALFTAAGAMAALLRDPSVAALVKPVATLVPGGLAGMATLVVVVPAICVLGIHPMPLFAVLAPLVPPEHLGLSPSGLYQLWIVTVGLSLLLSPASILTSITKTSFDLTAAEVGLRRNLAYAALFAAAAVALIAVINPA